jgi:hypothetical protein
LKPKKEKVKNKYFENPISKRHGVFHAFFFKKYFLTEFVIEQIKKGMYLKSSLDNMFLT